jgi:hypothetical protein
VASIELLKEHHVLVPFDNKFQREARLRQALWRERHGYPIGEHRGWPLGSRLAMPFAKDSLANYLTDTIRDVVRAEVLDAKRADGKLYQEPRIFDDLLSSQPLCFNLFAELQRDLGLASAALQLLMSAPGVRVTGIEFEHSPGGGDPRFTGDRSAFDVFVVYSTPRLPRAFIGIEVKYVEDLDGPVARHRPRYEEVADAMGAFLPDDRSKLRQAPLEQLWRDHLLVGSLALDDDAGFDLGTFAIIYPSENAVVADAVERYRACLVDPGSVKAWRLEDMVEAILAAGAGPWIGELRKRYLGGGEPS